MTSRGAKFKYVCNNTMLEPIDNVFSASRWNKLWKGFEGHCKSYLAYFSSTQFAAQPLNEIAFSFFAFYMNQVFHISILTT